MKQEVLRRWAARLGLIALFIFALVSNVEKIISNYHLRLRVDQAKAEVAKMELRNQKLTLLLSYYGSPSYQDIEARRRLGLKKPDETTFVLKGATASADQQDSLEAGIYQDATQAAPTNQSNISRWWQYFSGQK